MYKPITISQYKSDKIAKYKEAKNTRFIVELTKAGNITKRWEFRYQFNKKERTRTLVPTILENDRKILQQWRPLPPSPIPRKAVRQPSEPKDFLGLKVFLGLNTFLGLKKF